MLELVGAMLRPTKSLVPRKNSPEQPLQINTSGRMIGMGLNMSLFSLERAANILIRLIRSLSNIFVFGGSWTFGFPR
jgi:hypothetical protein